MKDENLFLYLKIGSKLYFIIHILTTLEYISNKVNNTRARVRMKGGRKEEGGRRKEEGGTRDESQNV